MKKEIYVNGYTRADGTEVQGYYRTIDTERSGDDFLLASSSQGQNGMQFTFVPKIEDVQLPLPEEEIGSPTVLEGHIEEYGYPTDPDTEEGTMSEEESTPTSSGSVISGAIANVIHGIASSAGVITEAVTKNIDTICDALEAAQIQSEQIEQAHLNKITNSKNQAAYGKNYQNYLKIRQKNINTANSLKRLKYGIEHKNADIIVDSLQNYQSNFQEVSSRNRTERPLVRPEGKIENLLPMHSISSLYNLVVPNKQVPLWARTGEPITYKTSQVLKGIVDLGMHHYSQNLYKGQIYDAKEMWKASSHDFKQSKDYVERNGSLVYSIKDLPDKEFQTVIQNKIQEQMGVNDSIGMVFRSDSNLAKQIANSPEMKDLFLKHKDELLSGQVVKGESTYFGSNQNLAKALGHADIYYAYIGQDGNMYAIVGDTYDMNKNDPDLKVRVARAVQDLGAMRTYYTLIVVKIPLLRFRKWLIN